MQSHQRRAILAHLTDAVKQRFASKVDRSAGPNGCWPFEACETGGGYRRFWLGKAGEGTLAHRVAWVIENGQEIPPGDFEVHHSCGSRLCVNPGHLELATHAENMAEVEARPCHEHEGAAFKKSADARLYCPECYLGRGWHHALRLDSEELPDLPVEAGARFLEWVWLQAIARRGEQALPLTAALRKDLTGFLGVLGERQAFLTMTHAVDSWADFRGYAAREYGCFNSNPDWAPARPRLDVITRSRDAAVNFWRETDEVELLIRAGALPHQIRGALEKRYGAGAKARLDAILEGADHAAAAAAGGGAPEGEALH